MEEGQQQTSKLGAGRWHEGGAGSADAARSSTDSLSRVAGHCRVGPPSIERWNVLEFTSLPLIASTLPRLTALSLVTIILFQSWELANLKATDPGIVSGSACNDDLETTTQTDRRAVLMFSGVPRREFGLRG